MATLSSTTTTAKPTECPGPESCHLLPPALPLWPLHTGTPERLPGRAPPERGRSSASHSPLVPFHLSPAALIHCGSPGTGGDLTGMAPIPPGAAPSRPAAPRIGSGQRARPQAPLLGSYSYFPNHSFTGGRGKTPFPELCPAGKAGSTPAPLNWEGGAGNSWVFQCLNDEMTLWKYLGEGSCGAESLPVVSQSLILSFLFGKMDFESLPLRGLSQL